MHQTTRGWQDYWDWKDKPIRERGAVNDVLEAAGVKFTGLRSREDDPPDCEAFIDHQWSGIEHSELVCQKNLELNIQDLRKSAANSPPKLTGPFAEWPRKSLLGAIQARIDEKDVSHKLEAVCPSARNGGSAPYPGIREGCLAGAKFKSRFLTHVFFGLIYHPAEPVTGEAGGMPRFGCLSDLGRHPTHRGGLAVCG